MRISSVMVPTLVGAAVVLTVGCGLVQLTPDGSSSSSSSSSTTTADAAVDAYADSGVVGGGCGLESSAQQTLCIAVSSCPSVVVDTEVFPNCGFQVVNGAAQLVCVCDGMICSMGAYSTCAQAQSLLGSQTQTAVCTQVEEGRCYAATAPSSSSSSTSSTSSSSSSTSSTSSSSGSSGSSSCDKTCLQQCGGGAGCASICGC